MTIQGITPPPPTQKSNLTDPSFFIYTPSALVPSKSIAQQLGVAKSSVPLKKLTIILVGSGGVGKSTLFKQLKLIYGEGFDVAEKKNALTHLLKYVLHSMRIVLKMGLDKALVELTSAIEINYEKLDAITFEEISPDKADLLAIIKGAMVELWAMPEVGDICMMEVCGLVGYPSPLPSPPL